MNTPTRPTTIAITTIRRRLALLRRRKPNAHQKTRTVPTGMAIESTTRSAVAHGDDVAAAEVGANGFVSIGPSWIGVDTGSSAWSGWERSWEPGATGSHDRWCVCAVT